MFLVQAPARDTTCVINVSSATRLAKHASLPMHRAAWSISLKPESVMQMLFETGMVEESAQVLVTGHSLGGALAMLAAYDIAVELKPHRLQVWLEFEFWLAVICNYCA